MPSLKLTNSPALPPQCKGFLLVTDLGLPRFWATVWADVLHPGMKANTKKNYLYGVERLYRHAEQVSEMGALDKAIAQANLPFLEVILTGFLSFLSNEAASKGINNTRQWESALEFVSDLINHIDALSVRDIATMQSRQLRLQRLYSQLRPAPKKPPAKIRALPAIVVEDLHEIFSPASPRNPFRSEWLKWRNFLIFLLMLHLGLRRGEIGLLAADAIKNDFDYGIKSERYWINVENMPYDDEDPRYDAPSLKTASSRRQLPINEEVLLASDTLLENYRKKSSYSYMFGSHKNKPISLNGINYIFTIANKNLSERSRKALSDRGIESVSPHDLRHTCAVFRLSKYIELNDGNIDLATEKLRVFFGWSHNSNMPRHYARAYYESSQADIWNENYDHVIASLRMIEGVV